MSLPSFLTEAAFGNNPGDTGDPSVSSFLVSAGKNLRQIAITPDGLFLYIADSSTTVVWVISTLTNTVVTSINVVGATIGIAMSPDGLHVYVANSFTNTVRVISTASNTVTATITVGAGPQYLAFTPDGLHVYVANVDGTVSVIATATNTVTATITVGTNPAGIVTTPDGLHVYVGDSASSSVSVISTASNTVTATITTAAHPERLAITPDGLHVYVSHSSTNRISVISTATNTVTATITPPASTTGIAITPNGLYAYVLGGSFNGAEVLATATNEIATTVSISSASILGDVSVAPDGSHAYVSDQAGFVFVVTIAFVVWQAAGRTRSFRVSRGRQYELDQIEAGTGTTLLRNEDGRLEPSNTGSIFYPNVVPVVPIRQSAILDSITYRIFTGFAERWPQARQGPNYAETAVPEVDGFELLTNAFLPGATYPQELSGARVTRVLNAIGWSVSARSIGSGQSQMPSYTFTDADGVNALSHLLEVALSEAGLFFIDGSGRAVFIDRHGIGAAASKATFTDRRDLNPAAIGYSAITPTIDKDLIANYWVGTRAGGATQIAEDTASIAKNFRRTKTRTPLLTTDSEVLDQMKFLNNQYADPRRRIESITVEPGDSSTAWAAILGLEIGDRINVIEHAPGVGFAYVNDWIVQNIDMSVTRHAAQSKIVLGLQFPGATMFTLDSAINGRLNGAAGLGY